MARFGQFMKDQLMPEDPMDWIIMFLVFGVIIAAIVIISMMYSMGLL